MRSAVQGKLAIALLAAAPVVVLATRGGVLSSRGVAPPRMAPAVRPAASGALEDCGAPGIRCGAAHATAACVEGRCALACDEGFADCDRDPADGCEVELASDPQHCGRCDRTCGGAACEKGRCVARLLGQGAAVAADDGAVYAHRGGVVKLPFDGTDEITLTQEDARDPPSGMAVDATNVYWALPKRRAVLSVPRAGGTITPVVEGVDAIGLAVAGGAIFWLEKDGAGGGVVKRIPVEGGTAVVAARLAGGAPLLLSGRLADAYYADGEGVSRLSAGSARPQPISDPARTLLHGVPEALAGDDPSLYWAARSPDGEGSLVMRVNSKDGEPMRLMSHPSRIRTLAANATHVFWSDARDRVFMAPKRPP